MNRADIEREVQKLADRSGLPWEEAVAMYLKGYR